MMCEELSPGEGGGEGEGQESADEGLGPVPHEDVTYDPDLIPGIITGDDVIEFYGKYGQDSPVKFFYCNKAKAALRFRPYDLVVTARQKVHISTSSPLASRW
ncbi:uncharacterized protein HaLaN_10554 [Haematococcus lacustris]|uniref:Uncharacterized protein n=1 Tax=Haematococcus lacustris TaxID=44745 RepID=A0A699YXV4_HAELA|nr:uncharacterized protein HaLaN_10554 [Haematococcus lacustris]